MHPQVGDLLSPEWPGENTSSSRRKGLKRAALLLLAQHHDQRGRRRGECAQQAEGGRAGQVDEEQVEGARPRRPGHSLPGLGRLHRVPTPAEELQGAATAVHGGRGGGGHCSAAASHDEHAHGLLPLLMLHCLGVLLCVWLLK